MFKGLVTMKTGIIKGLIKFRIFLIQRETERLHSNIDIISLFDVPVYDGLRLECSERTVTFFVFNFINELCLKFLSSKPVNAFQRLLGKQFIELVFCSEVMSCRVLVDNFFCDAKEIPSFQTHNFVFEPLSTK